MRSERGSGLLKAVLFFLVVAVLAFGLGMLQRSRADDYDPSVVYCGDEVMRYDQVCWVIGGNSGGGGDYGEMREQQERNHEIGLTVGRVSMITAQASLALAVLLLVIDWRGRARRRRADREASARPPLP